MAFAGHVRSIDLSYTSAGIAYIDNIHPERHRHILADQTSPKRANHAPPNRSKSHSSQLELNKDAYGRNQGDEVPSNKLSFRDALASGTDDMGNTPTRSLWIGNVPPGLIDDDLRQAFGAYGPILSVRATPIKHCGFVNFEMVESAMRAWHECHETDIFNTGVPVYVRYEKPPSWLKDKHPSLKRKRSSVNSQISFPDESNKRSAPSGPKSQASNNVPPSGPKFPQTSISPPPLRRHDTYRPRAPSEEDRQARKTAESHRQNDLYRPSYDDDDVETVQTQTRSSIFVRDARDRVRARDSSGGWAKPDNIGPARSPSPSASSLHSSNRENDGSYFGIGIKGLAASRRDSTADDRRPGLLIKGAAAHNRAAVLDKLRASPPRKVVSSRESLSNGQTPHITTHPVGVARPARRPRSLSPEKARVESELPKAGRNGNSPALPNGALASGSAPSRDYPAVVKENFESNDSLKGLHHPKKRIKQVLPSSLKKAPLGFDYLSHLIATKEKEDMAAQKARTISPLNRVRASSRATVASAKTDPTPIYKPLLSAPDRHRCGVCKADASFMDLRKCSVPSCFTRMHLICGQFSLKSDPTIGQRMRILCSKCSEKEQGALETEPSTNSAENPMSRHQQDVRGHDVEKVISPQNDETEQCLKEGLDYSFVSVDSAMIVPNGSAEATTTSHDAQHSSTIKSPQIVDTLSESRSRSNEKAANHKAATRTSDRQSISRLSTQSMPLPPTEPRLMRDGDVDEEALEISIRYKETVTCPWWKRGNKCVRHEKDCIFAHRWTGIESPNGRSIAKDWTCFDYGTSMGCRYSEIDCLYSHRDTGLYVGLDGKASKKHLECYWWRFNGRCTFSDSLCACAHYSTGLVAEEPMPRDTVRRLPQQPLVTSVQDTDTNMDLHGRSPSYSPPPPPTANSDSLFVAQWPLQALPNEILNAPQIQNGYMTPRLNFVSDAEAGVDPRLKRILDSGSQSEKPKLRTENASTQDPPPISDQQASFDGGNSPKAVDSVAPQQSKQRAMNPCKNCSKLVFKAEICTDCLKLSQRRESEQTSTTEHVTNQDKMDGSSAGPTPKTTVFAVPAPKVLKRSRTGSSSNLFASKRMRPDMTAIRTSTGQSSTTSNGSKTKEPLTLEQINRVNAKKRAKENAKIINDDFRPSLELSTERIDVFSPLRPTFSPFTSMLESPNEITQQSPVFEDELLKSKRPIIDEQAQNDTIEVLREAYGELEHTRSRSGSDSINCDSDTPLAALRHRGDKQLWSSSTSNQSPQESRDTMKTAIKSMATAPNGRPVRRGPEPRCKACCKSHRKCVHDEFTGEYDDRKCYLWQQNQITKPSDRKDHYSKPDRREIIQRARQYESALHGSHEAHKDESKDNESDVLDDDDVRSTSSDEIQKPHDESLLAAWQAPISRSPMIVSEPLARSNTHENRPTFHQKPLLETRKADSDVRTTVLLEEQERAAIIARLKAKGAVFEDSDTDDDDVDDGNEVQAHVDTRIDPLLYHKQKNAPPATPVILPRITKGQGLKNPLLIQRRQMQRNFQMFGDPHKEVDRQIAPQEVTALVERRDPADILAPPKEVEEKITFQEFLGLPRGKEIESCLGKVSLPRGKFTMGLAFREKEIDPGLGAWGRERRGTKKEKPVYVVGL